MTRADYAKSRSNGPFGGVGPLSRTRVKPAKVAALLGMDSHGRSHAGNFGRFCIGILHSRRPNPPCMMTKLRCCAANAHGRTPPRRMEEMPSAKLDWKTNQALAAGKGATVQEFVATIGNDKLEIDVAPWGEGHLRVN